MKPIVPQDSEAKTTFVERTLQSIKNAKFAKPLPDALVSKLKSAAGGKSGA